MKNLKIDLKRTPEQLELVKKLGSKNKLESMAAAEAIASVLAAPILQVIEQAPVMSNLFTLQTFDEGTPATVQLDPYFDVRNRNYLNVWASTIAGGTATNTPMGVTELFMHIYEIASAISMNKKTLRAGRLDYLAASVTRLLQEVLLVRDTNAANILMSSLAGARVDGNTANNAASNLVLNRSNTAGVFQLDDLNTILTGYDNVLASWANGTPVEDKSGIKDLLGSVHFFGQIRSMSYQPVNTRSGALATSGASSLAAPDSLREQIFNSSGIPTIYDINLHKVFELGVGKVYNTLFSNYIGSTAFTGNAQSGTATFGASEQIVIGLNPSIFDLICLRERGEDGGEFSLQPDDNFTQRSGKVGMYGGLREAFASVDGRAKYALAY